MKIPKFCGGIFRPHAVLAHLTALADVYAIPPFCESPLIYARLTAPGAADVLAGVWRRRVFWSGLWRLTTCPRSLPLPPLASDLTYPLLADRVPRTVRYCKLRPQNRFICMSPSSIPSADTSAATVDRETVADAESRETFVSVFNSLREDLLTDVDNLFEIPREAREYIARNINYNVPHGKLTRGLAVHRCFTAFRGGEPAEREIFLAHVLGWCVEWLQAFFLVADDVMDDSLTRRGQPCFFRLPGVGLNAVNDSIMLELMIYRLLKKHFCGHPAYPALVELFQEITYVTEIGQMLDLTSQSNDGVVNLACFTTENLHRIYRYKTSHYSFYLPVALGMRLAGVVEEAKYLVAKEICLALGEYFQAQDDYIDAFGDPEVTGKVGTDIEDNKCTWLVVEALKSATENDRAVLAANYAKKDPSAVDVVKDLYRRLNVPESFAEYEHSSYKKIRAMIDNVTDMPTGAFEFLLAKIYKREK